MSKITKTFVSGQILSAQDLNEMVRTINELDDQISGDLPSLDLIKKQVALLASKVVKLEEQELFVLSEDEWDSMSEVERNEILSEHINVGIVAGGGDTPTGHHSFDKTTGILTLSKNSTFKNGILTLADCTFRNGIITLK